MMQLRTTDDLDFRNDVLSSMCVPNSPFMEALAAFTVRVAYAPILDDGVVAWSTAALTGQGPQAVTDGSGVILNERTIGTDTSAEVWIGAEDTAYFVSDRPQQSKRQQMW